MTLTSPHRVSALPRPVRVFWALNIFLSALCLVIMRGGAYLLHWNYPYTFPFINFLYWIDLLCFRPRFNFLHSAAFFSTSPLLGTRFMYPAPMALLYGAFYLAGPATVAFFLSVTLGLVLLLAVLLGRAMVRRGVSPALASVFLGSVALFSYPFWFEYLLGNMEICVFLIVAFAVLAFLRGYLYVAATLIGLAASMKIFPFVYLGLFLSRRQYRQAAFAVLVAIASNLVSLWVVCPSLSVAYRGINHNLDVFRQAYMLHFRPTETGFDHSLFAIFKRAMFHLHHPPAHGYLVTSTVASVDLTVYMALAAAGGIALYFLRIRHLPLLNQILCLVIASVLLPPTSHDYTLMHLYVPWGLLVLYAIDRARTGQIRRSADRPLLVAFLCFGILFSAQSELIQADKGWSGQLKAVTLVVLFITALRHPFPPLVEEEENAGWRLDRDPSKPAIRPISSAPPLGAQP